MKNLKPFDLQAALSGKAVMLRDGKKAYVRHHETELNALGWCELLGYRDGDGVHRIRWSWGKSGSDLVGAGIQSPYDIVGMYPETRIINGFEVPAPETQAPPLESRYYLAEPGRRAFYSTELWADDVIDKSWLERGLVFLNAEDAIATAKAMLGIDPYEGDES